MVGMNEELKATEAARASFNGAGAATVDMAASGELAQKWAWREMVSHRNSGQTGPNDEQDQSSSLLIMSGRFPATSLLASVVIPTRQKVLDVKSRLMTCAYILERISSRSPQ
jgi:hypothetical protein